MLSSNISEYIDFNLSYSANINVVKNSIQPNLNNNYFTQSAGIVANFLPKKDCFFKMIYLINIIQGYQVDLIKITGCGIWRLAKSF